jgi:hypothetical protein
MKLLKLIIFISIIHYLKRGWDAYRALKQSTSTPSTPEKSPADAAAIDVEFRHLK